jgi:GTP-binding protein
MTDGNFVDYVKVHIVSGNGGKGSTHLHREKFVAKGGPDGGDGGRGGHVIIRANSNLWTLVGFKHKQHFKAGHGEHGSKNRSTGADGEDVYVDVPLGTVVKDAETDEVLAEITEESQEYMAAEGGMGGRGNWHFKTSTNKTTRYAQPGIPGV